MLQISKTPYSVPAPGKLFNDFAAIGNETLVELRNSLTNPDHRKKPRTWGSLEAAQLVNVASSTLSKLHDSYIQLHGELPGIVSDRDRHKRWDKRYTLLAINLLRDFNKTRYIRPIGSKTLKIAVSNLKGGVGKTQTAVDLAKKLAIEGLRVLLLDFDPQGTATLVSSGLIPDVEIEAEKTIRDALLKDPSLIHDIIMKTNFDGFDLVPTNLAIQDCDLLLPDFSENNHKKLGPPISRLEKALSSLEDQYDVILIDCAPNLGALTLNALYASNGMIIPIPPNMRDYSSFLMYAASLAGLYEDYPDKSLEYVRILLTKHPKNSEAEQVEDLIKEQFRKYVLKNSMCETIEVSRTANEVGTIYDVVKRPTTTQKESYQRAVESLDKVNTEIISGFKEIWDIQSKNFLSSNAIDKEVDYEHS